MEGSKLFPRILSFFPDFEDAGSSFWWHMLPCSFPFTSCPIYECVSLSFFNLLTCSAYTEHCIAQCPLTQLTTMARKGAAR